MQPEMVVPPRAPLSRAENPLLAMLRAQPLGPVMLRPQSFNVTPQRVMPLQQSSPQRVMPLQQSTPQRVMPLKHSTPQPQEMVTRENPGRPTIIGFSLPQLLSKVQGLLPRMEQAMPRIQAMPAMEFFSRFDDQDQEDQESFEEHDEHSDEQEQHTMEFQLPSMDDVFSRLEQALPAMEQRIAPAMNRVMEIEIANPFEDYEDVEMIEESPRMSMPWGMPRGIFGQSSRQEVNQGFGFSSLLNHLTNNIMSSQVINHMQEPVPCPQHCTVH